MLGGVQGAGAPSTGGGGRREADVGRGGSWIFRCSADFSSAAAEGLFTCRGLAALIFAFARGKATVPLGIAADIRQQPACYNDSLGLRSGGRQLLGFGRCFLSERHCVFSLVARLCHRRRLFIKQTTCMRCRPLASDCATAVRPQGSASYIAAVPACKEPGTRCARTSVPRRVPNERWAAP